MRARVWLFFLAEEALRKKAKWGVINFFVIHNGARVYKGPKVTFGRYACLPYITHDDGVFWNCEAFNDVFFHKSMR